VPPFGLLTYLIIWFLKSSDFIPLIFSQMSKLDYLKILVISKRMVFKVRIYLWLESSKYLWKFWFIKPKISTIISLLIDGKDIPIKLIFIILFNSFLIFWYGSRFSLTYGRFSSPIFLWNRSISIVRSITIMNNSKDHSG
jgi:hypothetical protein